MNTLLLIGAVAVIGLLSGALIGRSMEQGRLRRRKADAESEVARIHRTAEEARVRGPDRKRRRRRRVVL